MSKSQPAQPNYEQAAQQQGQSSREQIEQQTVANRPNVTTPFGSETWQMKPTYDPVSGKTVSTWTQNIGLAPSAQAALTSQQTNQLNQSQLAEALFGQEKAQETGPVAPNMGIAGVPDATTTAATRGTPGQFDTAASDAAMKMFTNYNEPLMSQAREQLDTQLRNQGLEPGTKAYDDAMTNLRNSQGLQTSQAEQQAILTGHQLGAQDYAANLAGQQQEFGQNTGRAQYQDTASQMQLAEDMQKKGFTLNQIQAILSGQQVGMPSMPSFSQAGAAQPTQYLDAAKSTGQGMLDQFNAQQAGTQGLESGIASVGGAALMAFF